MIGRQRQTQPRRDQDRVVAADQRGDIAEMALIGGLGCLVVLAIVMWQVPQLRQHRIA